jgi:hypothetical protein
MRATITIDAPDEIDLEHALESISDALFFSDNVTSKEQLLVIQLIQKLKREYERRQDS